ncbi:hypothetical protein [Methanobrevibacter sp.]|uniref:hypothetical protein n=1 Tax=Methanobrevibacter sp. TaxID=66852 RepID=UPI0038691C18
MFKKLIVCLVFFLMMISAVSAVNHNDFTAPDDFKKIREDAYVLYGTLKNADELLSIVEYTEYDWNDYTHNDTEYKYTVFKGENNTFNYTDYKINEVGSFELVESQGNKYIIDFSIIGDDTHLNKTYAHLLEFNRLNNIGPIEK